jgi:superfamily II DNA/RNA helicase
VVDEPAPGFCARREAIILSVQNDTTTESSTPENSIPENDSDPTAEVLEEAHPLQGGAPVKAESPTFAELGVRPEIVKALAEAGIERTFAIQELTLPLALAGEDVIGQARTGMGKTLGFGVPLLQRVVPPSEQPAATTDGEAADRTKDVPQALVVVPTRELCVQVAKDIADAGKHLGVRVTAIYGGRAYEPQLAALRKGVDVVVGTPGRLLDLAEQRHLVLGRVKALVLDEADEMLDLGFLPDVERIMRMLPEKRHTMLFSATMPGPIIALSRAFLDRPTHIRAEEADQGSIHERTRQLVYRAHAMDKVELLTRVLQAKDRGLTMIFARTKRTVQRVADDLADRGFAAAAVHGDLGQGAREQALRAFRSGKVDVLVATDVAARGIDVTDVTHVINYQCPEDSKTYIHRIGRTGRAGKEGVAVTLVDWDELHKWKTISDDLGLDMPEAIETYSTSDHLYTDLDIPTNAKGRLPHSQRTRAGLDAEYVDTEGDHGGRRRSGDRNGSDRGGSDRNGSGRGGRGADEPVTSARKPRRERSRTRSRAGVATDGSAGDTTTTTATTATSGDTATAPSPAAELGADSGSQADGEAGKPRRRRRRGGARRRGESGSSGGGDIGDAPTADAAAS